jgi:hypothetical protein
MLLEQLYDLLSSDGTFTRSKVLRLGEAIYKDKDHVIAPQRFAG